MSTRLVRFIETCDFSPRAAIIAFVCLNEAEGKTLRITKEPYTYGICTDDDPAKMLFPAGWCFTGHNLSNMYYSRLWAEIPVRNSKRGLWNTSAIEDVRQLEGKDFSASVCAKVVAALNDGARVAGPSHVVLDTGVNSGDPIYVFEGWSVCGVTDMGFVLMSGSKTVTVSFTNPVEVSFT